MFHDQPLKPLDKAVFWIEYVIRHNGAHHLKTSANNLNWIQFLLIDVIFVLSIIIFIFLVIARYTMKTIFKQLFKRKRPSTATRDDDKKDK